jgi:hypothetical protein
MVTSYYSTKICIYLSLKVFFTFNLNSSKYFTLLLSNFCLEIMQATRLFVNSNFLEVYS